METSKPVNCWDFWQCDSKNRDDCAVYRKNLGTRCWNVPIAFRGKQCGQSSNCFNCQWYKQVVKE